MQRIACYSTVVMISIAGLVGCSSGWTFDSWRDALTFNEPSPKSTQSISELQIRAQQLEKLREYEAAAEVYAQILKQDHDHQIAQQRLTAIQRLKHRRPDDKPYGARTGHSLPVSRKTERRHSQRQRQQLPQIKPGPTGTARSIASYERSRNRPAATQRPRQTPPGRATVSGPRRTRSPETRKVAAQMSKKRVPLDQFMKPTVENKTAQIKPKRDIKSPGVVKLPAVYDAQTIRKAQGRLPQTVIEQVSMTTTLPEIAQPDPSAIASEELTLLDVQKRLSTHPADPNAIEMLVQGIRTENRIGRWEISSTLDVLIQQPDSKSLIVDSLSRALTDKQPEMRRNTALVIAGLGRNAQELMPAVEKRLNDREESVRAAAVYAIDEIR